MNTEAYREKIWDYMREHHPNNRIAYKNYGRSPWLYATVDSPKVDEYKYNHRGVLPEEVVADFDCDEGELDGKVLDLVKALAKNNVQCSVWRTNGKEKGGIHIHMLFDIPDKVTNKKLLKKLILQHYIGDLKLYGIDTQILGNHLIRFEGGHYDKLPTWKAGKKTLVYCHGDSLKKNKVPKKVWQEYARDILPYQLYHLRRGKKIKSKHETPKSIQFLLSDKFKEYKDGGDRALFTLASYYRELNDDELYKLLKDYNDYNLRVPLDHKQIMAKIKSVRNNKGEFVGETYRRELLKDIGAYNDVYGREVRDDERD